MQAKLTTNSVLFFHYSFIILFYLTTKKAAKQTIAARRCYPGSQLRETHAHRQAHRNMAFAMAGSVGAVASGKGSPRSGTVRSFLARRLCHAFGWLCVERLCRSKDRPLR